MFQNNYICFVLRILFNRKRTTFVATRCDPWTLSASTLDMCMGLSAQHPNGGACCPQILARFEGERKGGKEGKGGEKRRNKRERRGENTQDEFLVMTLIENVVQY